MNRRPFPFGYVAGTQPASISRVRDGVRPSSHTQIDELAAVEVLVREGGLLPCELGPRLAVEAADRLQHPDLADLPEAARPRRVRRSQEPGEAATVVAGASTQSFT